ncbi:MAG: peptidyl-prolyl cis-trans isomerase [Deferribacteraceae bacterium]|jgi:peptidyl-prolyl cis-trans isomerase D|nr:peptidyl-prolyl cis-trans isomerase [Deferribacteraceae bacterium]
MLTSMRKHRRFLNLFLWLVIFAFLATIVVVWGLGEKTTAETFAVKIGDRTIGYSEYQNRESNVDPETRTLMGDGFRQWFLGEVINSELLLLEANRLKIPVSNVETAAAITQTEAFMTNGVFDIEHYQTALEYNGLTPAAYESSVKDQIKINKMVQLIRDSVSVTDQEVQEEFVYQNTKLAASYFAVPTAAYINASNPADADLNAFFTENQERYRIAPQVKLKYVTFNPTSFEYTPQVSDEAVRERYTATAAAFSEPELLDLSEIYVKVPAGSDNETDKKAQDKISAAFADLKANKSFADVARQYSEDEFAANGGFIGKIARPEGELPAELATVFALKSGEVSNIVKTPEGYAIFRVDNHTEARVTPYDDVKDGIRMSMEDDARTGAYRTYIYGIYREVLSTGNITAYLAKNPEKFTAVETAFIAEDSNNAFITDPDIRSTLFTLGKTEVSPILEINGTSYIFEIADRVNSRLPELSEVRERVIADYKTDKAFEAAVADVNAKVTATSMTEQEFASASKAFNATVEKIPAFTRMAMPSSVAWASDLAEMLFKNKAGDLVTYPMPLGKMIYVVRVDSVAKPAASELAPIRESIALYLKEVKAEAAVAGVIDTLKTQHPVVVSPSFQ